MEDWNLSIVRNLYVSVPPLGLQHTFAVRVSDLQAIIVQQDSMTAASERLEQSLMAEVF